MFAHRLAQRRFGTISPVGLKRFSASSATNDVVNDTLARIFYAGGSEPKPATNKNHYRLYGHNLCPFVARARYALSAKGVEFQECMVDLNNKAGWHKELNGGLVPILETPQGDLIIESGIIAQFALESKPDSGINLVPSDPIQAAKMRVRMEQMTKIQSLQFGVQASRG